MRSAYARICSAAALVVRSMPSGSAPARSRAARIRLRDLRPSHVDKLLAEVNDGKRKTATVRRIHATLRSALTTAVKQQLITFNMAKNVELPTSQRPKVIPWEPAELGAFLDHIGTHRLGALFEVIAGTGLCRGEACGLRWDDVDFARRVIVVRQQIMQVSGLKKRDMPPMACPYCEGGHIRLMFSRPKTASGEDRIIDLDELTVGALLSHKLRQEDERRKWKPA
ncbi:hypothetical protein [Streptomyces subrutilus]|uniref:hypothetical protein n=1 Tax=Streptomyces subrutilus TaxID=36818 RepID=UPI002E0F90A7|nr:hypothetical protein OG479_12130 [Streptomyces subrutilus]